MYLVNTLGMHLIPRIVLRAIIRTLSYLYFFCTNKYQRQAHSWFFAVIIMFLFSTSLALYFLGSLVKAQSTNDTALGIAAIEAHFTGADLVPSLLASFDPSAVMTVNFPGVGDITPGQNLTEDRAHLSKPMSS